MNKHDQAVIDLFQKLERQRDWELVNFEIYDYEYVDGTYSQLRKLPQHVKPEDYYEKSPQERIDFLREFDKDLSINFNESKVEFSEEELTEEDFFKHAIGTVYPDGVVSIFPKPSAENNYLLNQDTGNFEGYFFDGDRIMNFEIFEDGNSNFSVSYKLEKAPEEDE